jgi:plasmid stabilization system protein ParE
MTGTRGLLQSLLQRLSRRQQSLLEHPLIGKPTADRPEFRELVLEVLHARYVFLYANDGSRVVILRVFHGRELRE